MVESSDEGGEFLRQARLPDAQIDLVRAALGIASAFNPGLDSEAYAHEMDLMAEALAQRALAARDARATLRSLLRYFVEELEFRGNSADSADPRNSYLNEVLDRRLGIPITLCVIFMELGRRNGLAIEGIGYPGHFLVRWTDPAGEVAFIDPFNHGRTVPEATLLGWLAAAGLAAERSRSLLTAVTKRQILTRMLQNLKASFASRQRPAEAMRASALVLAMSPWDLDERRDHGLFAHAAGEYETAIADLETYLTHQADAIDAQRVERQLARIRAEFPGGRNAAGERGSP